VFADYLADLDMLLDHYAPGQAVDLVGHSMGGNVAMMYAGVRPERIRRWSTWKALACPPPARRRRPRATPSGSTRSSNCTRAKKP
jgi:pimeloyl-ACP methyl ester carboxylesterase